MAHEWRGLFLMTAALSCMLVAGDERADTALDACGMPRNYRPTSHCFNDRTHHTCCLLGPEARKYADASGNPIGTASSNAFRNKQGVAPTDDDLTPWCTCFGQSYDLHVPDSSSLAFLTVVFRMSQVRWCAATTRRNSTMAHVMHSKSCLYL